jgi:hypothetical protein
LTLWMLYLSMHFYSYMCRIAVFTPPFCRPPSLAGVLLPSSKKTLTFRPWIHLVAYSCSPQYLHKQVSAGTTTKRPHWKTKTRPNITTYSDSHNKYSHLDWNSSSSHSSLSNGRSCCSMLRSRNRGSTSGCPNIRKPDTLAGLEWLPGQIRYIMKTNLRIGAAAGGGVAGVPTTTTA